MEGSTPGTHQDLPVLIRSLYPCGRLSSILLDKISGALSTEQKIKWGRQSIDTYQESIKNLVDRTIDSDLSLAGGVGQANQMILFDII